MTKQKFIQKNFIGFIDKKKIQYYYATTATLLFTKLLSAIRHEFGSVVGLALSLVASATASPLSSIASAASSPPRLLCVVAVGDCIIAADPPLSPTG
jgi:hypothetical protein